MRSLLNFRTWLLLSLLWISVVGFWCVQSWPRLPLDVSSIDPETLKVFEGVKLQHMVTHFLAAILPPALAYGAGRILCQRTGCKSDG